MIIHQYSNQTHHLNGELATIIRDSRKAIEQLHCNEPILEGRLQRIQDLIKRIHLEKEKEEIIKLFFDKLKGFKEETACKQIDKHVAAVIESHTDRFGKLLDLYIPYCLWRFAREDAKCVRLKAPTSESTVARSSMNNTQQQSSQADYVLALDRYEIFKILNNKVVIQKVPVSSVPWQKDLEDLKRKPYVSSEKLFEFIEDLPPGLQEEGIRSLDAEFQEKIRKMLSES